MIATVAVNGELERMERLRLQDFLQGYAFGAGFFETILVTGGVPMFLARHLDRLRGSLDAHAAVVRPPPAELLTPEAVLSALRRCLEVDPELGPQFTGVAKLSASDGRLLLSFRGLPPGYERTQREGRSLERAETTCYRRGDRTLNHKSLSYFRQFAHMEQMPVFCNEARELCEAPTANLFFLREDGLVTPPLDAPCLPGVVRAILLGAGRLGGLPISVRAVGLDQLETVRGCIMTNSVSLAIPVRRLLDRPLPESEELAARALELIRAHAVDSSGEHDPR